MFGRRHLPRDLRALARGSTLESEETELGFDDALDAGIARYIMLSNALLEQIDAHLTAEIGAADGVIIWGAGQLAMKLLSTTVLARVPVVAIVDGSPQKHGLHLNGIPIVAPEKLAGSTEPIVVTSVHHETSILRACADLGLTNRLIQIPRPSIERLPPVDACVVVYYACTKPRNCRVVRRKHGAVGQHEPVVGRASGAGDHSAPTANPRPHDAVAGFATPTGDGFLLALPMARSTSTGDGQLFGDASARR